MQLIHWLKSLTVPESDGAAEYSFKSGTAIGSVLSC